MNGASILVTGGGGFLGGRLAEKLKKLYPQANLIVARRGSDPREFSADLSNFDQVRALLEIARPDYVFHLAGGRSSHDWESMVRDNVFSTTSLLEAIQQLRLSTKVLIPGSAAEYGSPGTEYYPLSENGPTCPVNRYGHVKFWQTSAALQYAAEGVHVVVARIFNILGHDLPERFAAGSFAAQLRKIAQGQGDAVLKVGSLSARRDYLDLEDVLSGVLAVAQKGKSGEIYNICSGEVLSTRELLERMMAEAGVKARILEERERLRSNDIELSQGSPEKAARELGWKTRVSLSLAIRNTVIR